MHNFVEILKNWRLTRLVGKIKLQHSYEGKITQPSKDQQKLKAAVMLEFPGVPTSTAKKETVQTMRNTCLCKFRVSSH